MREIVVDTVKLVIDVPKEVYEKQKYAQYFGAWSTVLQKHFENGKLISADALDKIRAEIESQRKEVSNKNSENNELQAYYHGLNDGLKDARDIIDKYKTESEDK